MQICCFFFFLKGEVLFDRLHPSLPPDVIVSTEDDTLGFEVDLENIKVCVNDLFTLFALSGMAISNRMLHITTSPISLKLKLPYTRITFCR